jgi:SAM-dependent methyltransferase
MATEDAPRTEAYGQSRAMSPVDRLGTWLSARRVFNELGDVRGKRIVDVGCGYHARLARALLQRGAGDLKVVDVALAADLKKLPRMTAIEGVVPDALRDWADGSADAVVCNSVLEHLSDPETTLTEIYRLLAVGGVALVNVPTWRGKRLLEFSAFRLGLSPAEEMNDHKMYYDPPQLWPLLVRAGFRPRDVRCFRHKFGLNTWASCRKVAS